MKIYEMVMREQDMPRVTAIKPGEEAEIDMGSGIKTVVDLKKNPTALIKDPTGKVMMTKAASGATGGSVGGVPQKPEELIKPGEPVFVADQTMEDRGDDNPMAQAVARRIVNRHPEWISRYGVEFLMQTIDDVTEGEGDWEEIGSSDVSAYVRMVYDQLRDRGGDRPEMADRPPFTPGPSSDRDQFGNPIKHRARHLARRGMRKAQGLDEGARAVDQARDRKPLQR